MYEWPGYCQLVARLVSNLLNDHQAARPPLSQPHRDDDDDHHHGDDNDDDDSGGGGLV